MNQLTKREQIAASCLQCILMHPKEMQNSERTSAETCARLAVDFADAMLAELSKTSPPPEQPDGNSKVLYITYNELKRFHAGREFSVWANPDSITPYPVLITILTNEEAEKMKGTM